MAIWSGQQLGRLRMSVGYGGHKRGRPMSPIEVGLAIRGALDAGATMQECAAALQFQGTGHIGRFVRILKLPRDLQYLVDWGAGKGSIGFTAAFEMVSLATEADQRAVANAILARGLTSKEVRQVAQLRRRTGRSIDLCISEALGMRTVVDRKYVFLGSVGKACREKLVGMSQETRNQLLAAAMHQLGLRGATGRLGNGLFTLVGGEHFHMTMNRIGKDSIEQELRSRICQGMAK